MREQEIKKVLILRLSALGDTIHTLPIAYAIKKAYPNCQIGWVVEDKASLFVKNNPLIDKCYEIPKKQWKKRGFFSTENIKEFFAIINSINKENYDVVLDTQQLFKSASLLPFLKIKRKITLTGGREFHYLFANEIYEQTHKLFDPNYHVVERNLEFAKHINADTSEVKMILQNAPDEVKAKIDNLLLNTNPTQKTVICSPATTWENKHWQESQWGKLIEFLSQNVNIVFTGMETDKPLIKRILEYANISEDNITNLAGKTNLEELAEVFRRGDLVISPDSGSAHVAWATAKPSIITIFTATAEKRNAPYGKNCYVVTPQIDCRPCMKKNCKRQADKNLCCELIKAEEVINLVKNILQL